VIVKIISYIKKQIIKGSTKSVLICLPLLVATVSFAQKYNSKDNAATGYQGVAGMNAGVGRGYF